MRLLAGMRLATGHADVDQVLGSLVALCAPEISRLLSAGDEALSTRAQSGPGALEDPALEVLSEEPINMDAVLDRALRRSGADGTVTHDG
jgi:hypothetical protein